MARRKNKKLSDIQPVFNKFIRLRDSNKNGMGKCFTCGRPGYYKEMDAGHFIPATKTIHRFNEKNVHMQCKYCNKYLSGNLIAYTLKMQKKYGKAFVDYLHKTQGKLCKLSQSQRNEKYDHYYNLCKELEKKKNNG